MAKVTLVFAGLLAIFIPGLLGQFDLIGVTSSNKEIYISSVNSSSAVADVKNADWRCYASGMRLAALSTSDLEMINVYLSVPGNEGISVWTSGVIYWDYAKHWTTTGEPVTLSILSGGNWNPNFDPWTHCLSITRFCYTCWRCPVCITDSYVQITNCLSQRRYLCEKQL